MQLHRNLIPTLPTNKLCHSIFHFLLPIFSLRYSSLTFTITFIEPKAQSLKKIHKHQHKSNFKARYGEKNICITYRWQLVFKKHYLKLIHNTISSDLQRILFTSTFWLEETIFCRQFPHGKLKPVWQVMWMERFNLFILLEKLTWAFDEDQPSGWKWKICMARRKSFNDDKCLGVGEKKLGYVSSLISFQDEPALDLSLDLMLLIYNVGRVLCELVGKFWSAEKRFIP